MQQKHNFWRQHWQPLLRGIILLAVILSFSGFSVAQSQTQQVTVSVFIQATRISWADGDCQDSEGDPEIYFKVWIGGFQFPNSKEYSSPDKYYLVNLTYNRDVPFSSPPIAIRIEQWESDDFLNGGDDQCDINPGPGKTLNMNLDLMTCQVTGDVTGQCGTTIAPGGPSQIRFTLNSEEPPSTGGLNVRCLHSPIWPQPGNNVSITAVALDGNATQITTQPVGNLEIWIDNTSAPVATSATTPGSAGASFFAKAFVPAIDATDFLYRCRVIDNGLTVSSGWRRVQIGPPPSGRAVPVIFTQFRQNAVDVVFIPNQGDAMGNDFTGPNDPNFLTAVWNLIRTGYYSEPIFLARQDALNFWIAQDLASVNRTDPTGCTFTAPNNWKGEYSFADTGAILFRTPSILGACTHRDLRLLANPTWFARALLHETGHSPFGLADEYPNGKPAYWEPNPYPNIYDTAIKCWNDAINLGRVANDCRSFMSASGVTWFTSEPPSNDLMNDNLAPRAADIRRINWLFDKCDIGQC